MKHRAEINRDFRCIRCGGYVCAQTTEAAVRHRNHCPYCLWSRHLDLRSAGDRLSGCRSAMEPVGLTLKRRNKKYGNASGELMLIHCCTGCRALSINRIAGDDFGETVMEVFERAESLSDQLLQRIELSGIDLLRRTGRSAVCRQLFGELER